MYWFLFPSKKKEQQLFHGGIPSDLYLTGTQFAEWPNDFYFLGTFLELDYTSLGFCLYSFLYLFIHFSPLLLMSQDYE